MILGGVHGVRFRLAAFSDELANVVARAVEGVVALHGSAPRARETCGSGFAIDEAGHLVTNAHVIDGFDEPFEAVLPGGERRRLTLVGVDEMTDLALLRLEGQMGRPLALREKPARPGELCLAVGSPLGIYPESVSMGLIGAVGRTIRQRWAPRPLENAIQTDAAISPGNSGGPLVDVRGEVLGVNQCSDVRGHGLAFAIPAQTVAWVCKELRCEGVVRRAELGVAVASQLVSVGGRPTRKLIVKNVKCGPSEKVLALGDVLLEVGGRAVGDRSELYQLLTRDRIDRPLALRVQRGESVLSLMITPRILASARPTRKKQGR